MKAKRNGVVALLKQMQNDTQPIVKILEDDKVTEQIQNTRYICWMLMRTVAYYVRAARDVVVRKWVNLLLVGSEKVDNYSTFSSSISM